MVALLRACAWEKFISHPPLLEIGYIIKKIVCRDLENPCLLLLSGYKIKAVKGRQNGRAKKILSDVQ